MEFDWASSMSLVPLLSSLLILFIYLKTRAISKSAKSFSHIPGPKKLPLIGDLPLMLGGSAPHHLFRDLAAKYGPLMHLQLGERHFLIVSSIEYAKEVSTTHDINFAYRPPILAAEIVAYNYSDIGFAPYGDYWKHLKKIFTLELLSAKRVRSFRPIREEENKNLVRWLASCEGSPANLSERVYMSSYDVITRVSVGAKTRDREAVISVIHDATKLAAGFSLADLYPSIKWLPLVTGMRFKLRQMRRRIDKVLSSIIDEHRQESENDDTVEYLVDVLLKFQDGSDNSLTDDNIKGLLMGLFLAGSDTSPTVVEWAMSHMIRNPSILKKAQYEVRKAFDDVDNGGVDEEKIQELEYLKLVIKETLRLHPPTPLLVPRFNNKKCEVNGYEIPAKTTVIINAWALGRDSKYWGDDAEEFKPERFAEKVMDFKGNIYEYIPFECGRRSCPGISFGVANVEFTLAALLYHFDWEMPQGIKNEEFGHERGIRCHCWKETPFASHSHSRKTYERLILAFL